MRIVSLLPSATDIIAELGLIDSIVGISEDCNWPPEIKDKPLVARVNLDVSNMSSAEIDAAVSASASAGHSIYAVDAQLLDSLKPDLVITQDLCEVCAVSSGDLDSACPIGIEIFSMNPRTLDDVVDSVVTLAEKLGVKERGEEVAGRMRNRIDAVRSATKALSRPRVFMAEWIDPPYNSGHWLPEMVEAAGGENLLSRPGEYSYPTSWDIVLKQSPEIIVIAACGFNLEQAIFHSEGLLLPVRTVVVDGDAYFSRPSPRVADGVEQLARLLHPQEFESPDFQFIELPTISIALT